MRSTTLRWALAGAVGLALTAVAPAAAAAPTPQVMDDSQLRAAMTTGGGADILSTTRTIPHWWGSTVNPEDGVIYGYNMAGADPTSCSGAGCSVTVEVDIVPLEVTVGRMTFRGSDVVAATLASPQFTLNDYGATPAATSSDYARGAGGVLSQEDAGQHLQLLDATMRAQFGRLGAGDAYHLLLHPNVLPAQALTVPSELGGAFQSGRGVPFALVDYRWWSTQIQNLLATADPTHLTLYLSDNVALSAGGCCVLGYHAASSVAPFGGDGSSNGNAKVRTFAWGTYMSPGWFSRPNGGTYWAIQDILPLSHEIAEWADDPFAKNSVEPWSSVLVTQCLSLLETGDPVVGVGFAAGTNSFRQGPNPNGTQSADGYYHPQDEAYLPWFMRLAPNAISEPTQTPSVNGGRYTFLGDLLRFPGFTGPATC
jgi:hypothetical protein